MCETLTGEKQHTLGRNARPDQSNEYTQVQLGEPVRLLGLRTGMGEGVLTGAGMTQEQLRCQDPPPARTSVHSLQAAPQAQHLQPGWPVSSLAGLAASTKNLSGCQTVWSNITCQQARHPVFGPGTHMVHGPASCPLVPHTRAHASLLLSLASSPNTQGSVVFILLLRHDSV